MPFLSQRRLDVVTLWDRQRGRQFFFRSLLRAMSSIRSISGNPPTLSKRVPRHEDCLISCGDAGEAGSPVHQGFDNSKKRLFSRELNIESSPVPVGGFHTVNDQTVCGEWKGCVGVKKEKDFAFRDACAGIKLAGSATMSADHVI